jgi:hypothetical protein
VQGDSERLRDQTKQEYDNYFKIKSEKGLMEHTITKANYNLIGLLHPGNGVSRCQCMDKSCSQWSTNSTKHFLLNLS